MSSCSAPIDQARIADLLDQFGQELEELGVTLCGDSAVVQSHIASLQALDRIAQFLRGIASLLVAPDFASELAASGLGELQAALADQITS